MKKILLALIVGLFAMSFSEAISAQTIVLDTLAADGTRIVNFQPSKVVCSANIEIHTLKNRITFVEFTRGCNGNAKGIGALVKGMKVKDAIKKLDGITCGNKPTSCPDQLATALKMMQDTAKKKKK